MINITKWWNERRRINRIINRAVAHIVLQLEKKGLISIYKTGTILTKDQVYDSDIDLAIIVEPGFDFDIVNNINQYFESQTKKIYEGFFA